jgi:hypothetical protein
LKKKEGKCPNSFYETSITLTSKQAKDITRKENHSPKSPVNVGAKFLENQIHQIKYNHSPQAKTVQHMQINKCDIPN